MRQQTSLSSIGTFNGTLSPGLVNQAALLHKEIWPTGLTFVRVPPSILNSGWDGNPKPAGGYTGVDYAWLQYVSTHVVQGIAVAQALAAEKSIADSLNVGLAHSLNMWAGGIKTNFDGVTACWDYDLNSSTPTGIVVGSATNLPPGVQEGEPFACGSLPAGVNRVVANPNWIRRWADVVTNDPDIPFAGIWVYPITGTGVDWAQPYIDRSDFVSALDYAVNKAATRTQFNGYRTPKPPQP